MYDSGKSVTYERDDPERILIIWIISKYHQKYNCASRELESLLINLADDAPLIISPNGYIAKTFIDCASEIIKELEGFDAIYLGNKLPLLPTWLSWRI